MADVAVLDRAFQVIMQRMVDTGQAPHYTELAAALGYSVEEGRQTLHDLMSSGIPCWLHPGTDYIASFAPFNNLPTQYRMTIDGQQKWFAQCGFEALAVCWLFLGKVVRTEAPCLDCNERIVVEMRDGEFLRVDPPETVGHINQPWVRGGPAELRAFR